MRRPAQLLYWLTTLLLLGGCSGSRDDGLGTGLGTAGKADAEVDAEFDPEADDAAVDAEIDGDIDPPEVDEDTGIDVQQSDAGEGTATDAGDPDVIVFVITADAGTAVDATTVVEEATCGNGRSDPGEDCDQGASNSNTTANACRTNCRRAAVVTTS